MKHLILSDIDGVEVGLVSMGKLNSFMAIGTIKKAFMVVSNLYSKIFGSIIRSVAFNMMNLLLWSKVSSKDKHFQYNLNKN